MPNSRRIAGLGGPTIVAMILSEFPLVQLGLFRMFAAGLYQRSAAKTDTTTLSRRVVT
jgi:hypothetical protein